MLLTMIALSLAVLSGAAVAYGIYMSRLALQARLHYGKDPEYKIVRTSLHESPLIFHRYVSNVKSPFCNVGLYQREIGCRLETNSTEKFSYNFRAYSRSNSVVESLLSTEFRKDMKKGKAKYLVQPMSVQGHVMRYSNIMDGDVWMAISKKDLVMCVSDRSWDVVAHIYPTYGELIACWLASYTILMTMLFHM